MSFELQVAGGKTVRVEAWLRRAQRLGATIELHPRFVMDTHEGYGEADDHQTRS